jgi:hypothetical protein
MKGSMVLCFVVGMVTGMGNGSVFGATLMCFLGRAGFDDWGGWMGDAYNPVTFTGFIDWAMIVFGIAFYAILHLAVIKHGQLESKA